MSNRDHQQSGGPLLSTLLPAQPLTDHQRTLMTEFLMLDALHQRHLSRLEAALGPLTTAQSQRLFFQDIHALVHFRHTFWGLVGDFLTAETDLKYQLAFWEGTSHRKQVFDRRDLSQLHSTRITQGCLVETLNYRALNCRVCRTYTVNGHHLYWEQNDFTQAGQPVAWVDGLMALQRELEPKAAWLQQGILRIVDYT